MKPMTDEKRCSTCKETLPAEAFNKNRSKSDGLQSVCRECRATDRAVNSEKYKARSAAYYAVNTERVKAREAIYRKSGTCPCCGGPNDPRQTRCLGCRGGADNTTTLGRDHERRWSPCLSYLTMVETSRRSELKIGLGNERRASRGTPLASFSTSRGVAHWVEIQVLSVAGRSPVPKEVWPLAGGHTEVVKNPLAAWDVWSWCRDHSAEMAEDVDVWGNRMAEFFTGHPVTLAA